MRPVIFCAFVACASSGCGTVVNLNDPARNDPKFFNVCVPFGGVVRSGVLAGAGTVMGTASLLSGDFEGAALLPLGVAAIIDTPVSFVGDFVTLPVAYARQQEQPWATWWGSKSANHLHRQPQRTQDPEADKEASADGEKTSETAGPAR